MDGRVGLLLLSCCLLLLACSDGYVSGSMADDVLSVYEDTAGTRLATSATADFRDLVGAWTTAIVQHFFLLCSELRL